MRRLFAFLIAAAACGACSSQGHGTSSPGSGGSTAQPDGGAGGGGGGGGDAGMDAPLNMCSAAIGMILGPIDKVSTGSVSVLNTAGSVRTLYVDATAGGFGASDAYPRLYVNLETATQIAITDKQAPGSTAWDLAIKRPVLFTNDGDGGPGMGGTITVGKAFDQVTAADATGKFAIESFADEDCNPKTDDAGDILTTLSGWYDYNEQTNVLTPKPSTTYVIRGATGKLYKLGILTYYAEPDGGTGSPGGAYVLQIGGL